MADNDDERDDSASIPSFLSVNFDEVPEIEVKPEGEYEIKCDRVRMGNSKKTGDPYAMLFLSFADDPTGKDFTEVVMLPSPDSDPKTRIARLNYVRTCAQAFDVDISSGVNFDDFVGQTTWAILGERDDPQYGKSNTLREFIGVR